MYYKVFGLVGVRLRGGLSVLEICKISVFIASKTPSSLAVENYVRIVVFVDPFRGKL